MAFARMHQSPVEKHRCRVYGVLRRPFEYCQRSDGRFHRTTPPAASPRSGARASPGVLGQSRQAPGQRRLVGGEQVRQVDVVDALHEQALSAHKSFIEGMSPRDVMPEDQGPAPLA